MTPCFLACPELLSAARTPAESGPCSRVGQRRAGPADPPGSRRWDAPLAGVTDDQRARVHHASAPVFYLAPSPSPAPTPGCVLMTAARYISPHLSWCPPTRHSPCLARIARVPSVQALATLNRQPRHAREPTCGRSTSRYVAKANAVLSSYLVAASRRIRPRRDGGGAVEEEAAPWERTPRHRYVSPCERSLSLVSATPCCPM
ncbi:hypothetical protein PHLGIDRAFT_309341 [Phlebiopsis gigantea 11061_1 CR5-6]|uniref:Uncharacterized protein n=1 Tax=Phlebiopsis gigantea (strain 11061_1 CR5-6) TaxID=745531 RepID=A0A0C3RZX9_PHLG1|nr:hypothetical protein PHLGIDRAFT_309341 [Phlebiopsis gigantea 11061_1 CR5-6]